MNVLAILKDFTFRCKSVFENTAHSNKPVFKHRDCRGGR